MSSRFRPSPLLTLLLTSCAGPMDAAEQAFDEGRYPQAVSELRALELDCGPPRPERCTRYALFRGLTHLALGDSSTADRWLAFVKRRWDDDPSMLDREDAGRLLTAWRSLGHMPGHPIAP